MKHAAPCTRDALNDRAACFFANVDELRGKVARIASHHREMFEALERMARSLRQIEETYRRH